jgi:hypothetical protein
MLRQSAAKDGMSLAVIVLAAFNRSLARQRNGWNGEAERFSPLKLCTTMPPQACSITC